MAAHRLQRIEPSPSSRRAAESGYTLIEVMVAMLLTSIMVTSVFSVALTVKTGGSKGESKIKASAGARQVAALLKNYVTAEAGTASTNLPSSLPGPCSSNLTNNWSMTCPGGSNPVTDDCGGGAPNCYALSSGSHTLTGIMGAFEGAPWGARVHYFVDTTLQVNGRPVPAVSLTTTWTDP